MATEVFNWVQKYDADLDGRQVRDHSTVKTHEETRQNLHRPVQCDLVNIPT